jgi:hypothetical protein
MAGWHHGEWPFPAATPGVGAVTVIKPDWVDGPNLARTTYRVADIGAPKPDALARQVRVIDPAVVVDRHPPALGTTDMPWALEGVSLVVTTTDDMAEQAVLARHAHVAGVPLVACAMYKKAALGEAVPAAGTACWWSAVGAGQRRALVLIATADGGFRQDRVRWDGPSVRSSERLGARGPICRLPRLQRPASSGRQSPTSPETMRPRPAMRDPRPKRRPVHQSAWTLVPQDRRQLTSSRCQPAGGSHLAAGRPLCIQRWNSLSASCEVSQG